MERNTKSRPAPIPQSVQSYARVLVLCLFILTGATGCEIADKVFTQMTDDMKTHMFPDDIQDESPPLATDTYLCDSARQLMIYKNEGRGTAVIEYEGRAAFLERVKGTKDEIYKNNQTTLRIREDGMAEVAREEVTFLTNCKQQIVHHSKEFVN